MLELARPARNGPVIKAASKHNGQPSSVVGMIAHRGDRMADEPTQVADRGTENAPTVRLLDYRRPAADVLRADGRKDHDRRDELD